MNLQSLVDRVLAGETTVLEAKSVAIVGKNLEPHPDSIAQELAALANANGGHLLLGVDSERARVTGVAPEQLPEIVKRLDAILNDAIRPPLYFSTLDHGMVIDADGAERRVIAIEVPKSVFVHDVKGVAYVRVGTSKRTLDSEARARLSMQRSQSKLMRFDEMPLPQCAISDLNPESVTRLLANARVTTLSALKLLSKLGDALVPNVAAALLLSDAPQQWLRGAYIQAAIFRGTRNDPAQQVEASRFEGPLDQQIVQAWQFCKRYTRTLMHKNPARLDTPEYDELALFEAIANAVVHRDYSMPGTPVMLTMFDDRLEIMSPGALINTMTLESMRSIPMARNDLLVAILSRFFKTTLFGEERAIIEARNIGVPQILQRSLALSGREPIYELIESLAVKLTIFPARMPSADLETGDAS